MHIEFQSEIVKETQAEITLKRVLMKFDARMWTEFNRLRYCPKAGCCEHGNEHRVSIGDEEFIDQLGDYQLLKEDSVSWS
jgi:hypothetical protein